MLAALRDYFARAGVLEVETPLACRTAGTDPQLTPIMARYTGPGAPHGLRLYLQTSPEFAMKRLLAAGSGPIYQICKAFRDGEAGRLHNPEFSLLEWYRPGFDLTQLIDDVTQVLRIGLGQPDLAVKRSRYADLFREQLAVDVFLATPAELRGLAMEHHVIRADALDLDPDGWLDLLLSHLIQPRLGENALQFVTDYPATQAAMARLNPDGQTAARFEVFLRGVELANGYFELIDPEEQAGRFEADNCVRRSRGLAPVPGDRRLLAALDHGVPSCAGVAVGLDRVLMLRLQQKSLDDVMSFSFERC
jgi:lysyl-tRNA synthetase class 2